MGKTVLLAVMLAAVPALAAAGPPAAHERAAFARPDRIVFPDHAPYSPQIAALGKMLFFDPRLSRGQNMSCATCHNPSFGWETPAPKAIGALNVPLQRHTPSLENLAEASSYFWDGRAPTLELQAIGPLTHPQEMNSELPEVLARLGRIATYRNWFKILFLGEGLSEATLLRAIATYERTLRSGVAPFDAWVEGREEAIPAAARRGFALFVGKAQCAACHDGWAFTDYGFHDIGLSTADLGRFAVEPANPALRHAFKTPSLRNIALRAPYMHDGSLATLEEVLAHYASGGVARPSRAPQLAAIELSPAEMRDLIAFLETLTAPDAHVAAPALPVE
jgi:cytochrome c peroxidase